MYGPPTSPRQLQCHPSNAQVVLALPVHSDEEPLASEIAAGSMPKREGWAHSESWASEASTRSFGDMPWPRDKCGAARMHVVIGTFCGPPKQDTAEAQVNTITASPYPINVLSTESLATEDASRFLVPYSQHGLDPLQIGMLRKPRRCSASKRAFSSGLQPVSAQRGERERESERASERESGRVKARARVRECAREPVCVSEMVGSMKPTCHRDSQLETPTAGIFSTCLKAAPD